MGEYLLLFLQLMIIALGLIAVSLILHELGHMIGGKIGGYELVYIEFFGFVFWGKKPKAAGEKNRFAPGQFMGQCVMEPRSMEADPSILVSGGCVMTLILAVLSDISILVIILAKISSEAGRFLAAPVILSGIINTYLYIHNWLGSDPANDGNTYRLIKSERQQGILYNKIVMIAADLAAGRTYGDILNEDESRYDDLGLSGSLADELELYEFAARLETQKGGNRINEMISSFAWKMAQEGPFYDDMECEVGIVSLLGFDRDEDLSKITDYGYYSGGARDRELLKMLLYSSITEGAMSVKAALSDEALESIRKRILLKGQYRSAIRSFEKYIAE